MYGTGYVPVLNPLVTLLGSPVAGPSGVSFNRFAWVDPTTGQTSNIYTPGFSLGFVLPQAFRYARNGWTLANWSNFTYPAPPPPPSNLPPTLILRAGMMVDLALKGHLVMCFPWGALPGKQVYASALDGSCYTGVSGSGYVPTPWTTMAACGPNGRAWTSSYTQPFS